MKKAVSSFLPFLRLPLPIPIEFEVISLRHLLNMSPVLSGLTPMPSESTFVRCIKDSKTLERRMIVSTQILDDGGFEVRRRDWEATKERLRRYTSFQWDGRTVYVVCFSTLFRTNHSSYFPVDIRKTSLRAHGVCHLFFDSYRMSSKINQDLMRLSLSFKPFRSLSIVRMAQTFLLQQRARGSLW